MSLKITPKWNIFVEKLIPKSCLNCLKINDFLKNDAKANQLKQHRFKTCTPMSLNFETYANKNWTQQRFQNEFQSWIIVCSLSVYNYVQHKSEGKNSIVWFLKIWRAKLKSEIIEYINIYRHQCTTEMITINSKVKSLKNIKK